MAVRDNYTKIMYGIFQHYDNGNRYIVEDVCLDVTKKVHVVCYTELDTRESYVRTAEEFFGYVDRPDPQTGQMERVKRFTNVTRRAKDA